MTRLEIDAQHYSDHSSVQYLMGEDVLALYSFRGDEEVLDIGCGDGKLTAKIAENVPRGSVLGVDPSQSMIDLARKTQPHLSFELGRAEDFQSPFKFDLITAFCSLHWVHGQKRAIENLTSLLKPGGKLLILTFPLESTYYRVLEEVIQSPKWRGYEDDSVCRHWISSEEYRRVILSLGLEILTLDTVDEIAVYANEQEYRDYVKGWLPCLIPLPSQAQESFLRDLSAHARGKLGSAGLEGFGIPYNKIVIYAQTSS